MAALTGLLLFKKHKHTAARYFIYFLVYTVFVDLLGNYTNWDFIGSLNLRGTIFERNYWWYGIFWTIGSAVFYAFYFSRILETSLYKKIVRYSGVIFFAGAALFIIAYPDLFFNGQRGYVATASVIVILICVTLYFIEILQSDQVLSFYKSLNFYISISILIWWLVTTPTNFYELYFIKEDSDYVILKWKVYLISNVFMYSCFTFGLIYSSNKVNR